MRIENYEPWTLDRGITTKTRRDDARKRTEEGKQERKENQRANSRDNKPGAWSTYPKLRIKDSIRRGDVQWNRSQKWRTWSERPNVSTKSSDQGMFMFLCVGKIMCVCVMIVRFNNNLTHTHTHIYTTLSMCMHILEVSNVDMYKPRCLFLKILRQMYLNVTYYWIFEIFSKFTWILCKHLYQGDGCLISKWHLRSPLPRKFHN